jgi:hypothetical protein
MRSVREEANNWFVEVGFLYVINCESGSGFICVDETSLEADTLLMNPSAINLSRGISANKSMTEKHINESDTEEMIQMYSLKQIRNQYLCGDCGEILRQIDDNTFDLIITSPPYADARTTTYGGIHPDNYVEWFLPKAKEFLRVLNPTGTFILNIKERVMNGERHTYVIDLIKAMKQQGWFWTEEFIWHKKNTHPGKWPNRFRDVWERCLQFKWTFINYFGNSRSFFTLLEKWSNNCHIIVHQFVSVCERERWFCVVTLSSLQL